MHCDDERLAGHALGDPDLTPDERSHLAECERCQAELAELRGVLGLGKSVTVGDGLVTPPPRVWQAIRDELTETGDLRGDADPATPVDGSRSNVVQLADRRRRPWLLAAVAAAVVGVLVGVLATIAITADRPDQGRVIASSELQPLPGKAGSGEAELVERDGQQLLRVSVTGMASGPGFYELWLINSDGERMQSLGVVTEAGPLTYVVPAGLLPADYRIVDVSLEPDDGNPLHSRDSVLRGTLPT